MKKKEQSRFERSSFLDNLLGVIKGHRVYGEKMRFSPYLCFSRATWRGFGNNALLALDETTVKRLQSFNEKIPMREVLEVFLPLAQLLNLYVGASSVLHEATSDFMSKPAKKVPYLIGIAGSVAVGKSTIARTLQALLSRFAQHPVVELVTTDGFLYSMAELVKRNLVESKGFPESYDMPRLIEFLAALKSGESHVRAPIYSHHHYDIIPKQHIEINDADIVIVEGLNILQTAACGAQTFVSDFLDFTIFVDASTASIKQWFIERVLHFKNTSFQDPQAYFHFITRMSDEEVIEFCESVWHRTNERNLIKNILPYKNRARLILYKGANHATEKILLRNA